MIRDEINKYYQDYVEDRLTQADIVTLVGCSESYVKNVLGYGQKLEYFKTQEINKNNLELISFAEACKTIKQVKDKTIGDWGNMTSQEKEPYLVTSIQWRTL